MLRDANVKGAFHYNVSLKSKKKKKKKIFIMKQSNIKVFPIHPIAMGGFSFYKKKRDGYYRGYPSE